MPDGAASLSTVCVWLPEVGAVLVAGMLGFGAGLDMVVSGGGRQGVFIMYGRRRGQVGWRGAGAPGPAERDAGGDWFERALRPSALSDVEVAGEWWARPCVSLLLRCD